VAIVEDFGYWFDRKEEAVVTEKKVKKLRLSKKMGIFGGWDLGGEKRERDDGRQPATVISVKVLREWESDWEWAGCGGGVIRLLRASNGPDRQAAQYDGGR
jgi:hypothetical protein